MFNLFWLLACHWISDDDVDTKLDPDGDGFVAPEDCAPADPDVYPAREEVCDGVDNDCDGEVDEDPLDSFYVDGDGDGWGDGLRPVVACEAPEGHVARAGDCDDEDPTAHPEGTERCDDVDNDCDDEVDEDALDASTWYIDDDEDGHGSVDFTVLACALPEGFAASGDDCDDTTATVHPGRDEVCNDGIDNDCDGGAGDCVFPGTSGVDALGITLTGGSGLFGVAVAAGDFNGDGVTDLAVGAPTRGSSDVGSVFVFDGPMDSDAYAAVATRFDGASGDAFLGSSLVAIADSDGDGRDELLVGAPGAPNDRSMVSAGVAYLLGADALDSGRLSDAQVTLEGEYGYDLGGASVAWLDDRFGPGSANTDGRPELVVGAPGHDVSVTNDAGELCIVAGGEAGTLDLRQDARLCLWGSEGGMAVGELVVSLGDLDGDGLGDLLAGIPSAADGGRAYLITDPGLTAGALSAVAEARLDAVASGDALGASGADAGDFDGDGYADVLLGAPGHDGGGADAGAAWLVLGQPDLSSLNGRVSSAAATHWVGDSDGDRAGEAVAGVGDVNRDGAPDLLVAAPLNSTSLATENGRTYLFLGPLSGAGGQSVEAADARFDGAASRDQAGDSVTAAGDFNDDGLPDLAIASTTDGALYVIFGLGL